MKRPLYKRLTDALPQINLFYVFTIVAAIIVLASLAYSNRLVGRLAEKEERLVAFWADVYKFIAQNDNPETNFLANNIIIKRPAIITVPAVVVDQKNHPIMNNLSPDSTLSPEAQKKFVEREFQKMRESGYKPIMVEYLPGQKHFVYYRETDELEQLRVYPYITFVLMFIFIFIIFINFNIAQISQQNKVWAGLAKETAHQLGTPISGLIAWVEILRMNAKTEDDQVVIEELEKDIKHLQVIADRFSKIGSEPDLQEYSIQQVIENALSYVESRVSRKKVQLEFLNSLPAQQRIWLSPTLLEWVLENLLKNAIDALAHKDGAKITVEAFIKSEQVIIDVSDNGKGITRHDLTNIFKPGYTTKKRGWGLGLSLSKRIIERFHKGKIFVKKTEVDKGTTFRIQIPLVFKGRLKTTGK